MYKKFLGLTALSFLLSGGAWAAGTVSGKVNFKGAEPKAEQIKMNADPVCVKETAGKKVMKEEVMVNANKTLSNVFVYVKEGVKKESIPAVSKDAVKFDQHGCMYQPRVFGIRVGQPLVIINSDPTLHNVHSLPKKNAGFNNGMSGKGQEIKKEFKTPEMAIKIKCDVHGWMTAWAHAMEHPYFAVTGSGGDFSIKDLPPGTYKVAAWHEKLGEKVQDVTIAEGATQNVEFAF